MRPLRGGRLPPLAPLGFGKMDFHQGRLVFLLVRLDWERVRRRKLLTKGGGSPVFLNLGLLKMDSPASLL